MHLDQAHSINCLDFSIFSLVGIFSKEFAAERTPNNYNSSFEYLLSRSLAQLKCSQSLDKLIIIPLSTSLVNINWPSYLTGGVTSAALTRYILRIWLFNKQILNFPILILLFFWAAFFNLLSWIFLELALKIIQYPKCLRNSKSIKLFQVSIPRLCDIIGNICISLSFKLHSVYHMI